MAGLLAEGIQVGDGLAQRRIICHRGHRERREDDYHEDKKDTKKNFLPQRTPRTQRR